MPRLTRLLSGLMMVVALTTALVAGPASVQAATSQGPAVQALQAAAAVAGFRAEMNRILDDYDRRYGSRLAPGERTRMKGLASRVSIDLGRLEQTARVTARQSARGRQHLAAAAARRSVAAFTQSYARATATLAEVQPILQPHLGFMEALEAKAQVDEQFARFRAIGDQLTGVRDSLNP